MNPQDLARLETEAAEIVGAVKELSLSAKELVGTQRQLLTRIERDWQLHIDGNAQRAGETQAKAFGEAIAQGLHKQRRTVAGRAVPHQ